MTNENSSTGGERAVRSAGDLQSGKMGISLFLIYLVLFAGFVLLAAFDWSAMAIPMLGVNLAVVYGMALILAAIVLAFIYMYANRNEAA